MAEEKYSPDEFEKKLSLRGLCTKPQASRYVKNHPAKFYTEKDFEEAYREYDRPPVRAEAIRMKVHDEEDTFIKRYL